MSKKIFVTGHRNPDVDSLASAYALAELRRRQSGKNVVPVSPGIPSERAVYLFDRFKCKMPEIRNDLHLRIVDVMDRNTPAIPAGTSLYTAVKQLQESGFPRLPVVGKKNRYLGMLSPLALLSQWLNINDESPGSLTGRSIRTSIALIAQVIGAENPADDPLPEELLDLAVYVAAMGVESFDEHLPSECPENQVVIVGDRSEIHLRALQRGVRLLIVTGNRPVEPLIAAEARRTHTNILRTACDSATVIRRLKFSMPVEYAGLSGQELVLQSSFRVRDVKNKILNYPEDAIPVVDKNRFSGLVLKRSITSEPPFSVILVDHNEPDQSLPGVEEYPVIEVVDHHRIGMMPTANPIKFTGDTVGSTCTLVGAMFRSSGESLSPDLAGLLAGGIVTDTLNLRSPSTADADRRILEWLEKISGVKGSLLMDELSRIDSPLAVKPALEVIESDSKKYNEKGLNFLVSQVEESNLELLDRRHDELKEEMLHMLDRDRYDFIALLVTDAVRGNSRLLFIGNERIAEDLSFARISGDIFDLPGVVSRKKQLLPQLLAVISTIYS